jgi:MG2 domain/Macroglobulin domain MG3
MGDNFESSVKLALNTKQFSVFIQTDKAIYKPSDKIQFRVLILDSETKPFSPASVEIYITDGANNRIKQYESVIEKIVKGVYQNELQLSDSPVLGNWKIHVKVNGRDSVFKSFEIAEYVLPKFELILDANSDANYEDGNILATINARYTFGKKVKGNVTITAEEVRSGLYHDFATKKASKSIEIDGEKLVEFKLKEDLNLKKKWDRETTVELFATFTEALTGKEQNATAKVQIHTTPHTINIKRSSEKFKPGLPYHITALVKKHDKDAPVTDNIAPVEIKVKYYSDLEKTCTRRCFGRKRRSPQFGSHTWGTGSNAYDQFRFPPPTPISTWPSWNPSPNPISTWPSWNPYTTTFPNRGGWYDTTTIKPWIDSRFNDCEEKYKCREEKTYILVNESYLKNGLASLEIDIPSNTTKLDIEIKYKGTLEKVSEVKRLETESNQYIQANLLTKK